MRFAVHVHRVVIVEPTACGDRDARRAGARRARTRRATAAAPADRRRRPPSAPTASCRGSGRRPPGSSARRAAPPPTRRCIVRPTRAGSRVGPQVGIGVAAGKVDAVAQVIEERLRQLRMRRRAKADRIGGARVDRHAVVRVRGRQVQHVARIQHVVVLRREAAQDLDRQAGPQRQVRLPSVAPAAAAEALQQEHVVGIEVRPDAAARHGEGDHQVVEARERHEREPAQQRVGARIVQVHALHHAASSRAAAAAGSPPCGTDRAAVPSGRRCARPRATRRRRARPAPAGPRA